MKTKIVLFLSSLLYITSCTSTASPTAVETTEEISATFTPIPTNTVASTTETKDEKVLLDFALSPNGKILAIYLNSGVYFYDTETLKQETFLEFETDEYYAKLNSGGMWYPPLEYPGALAFSPDGNGIAVSGKFQDELIRIWDLKNKASSKIVYDYPNGSFIRGLEYSSDGSSLLVRSTYPLAKLRCENDSEDTYALVSLKPKDDYILKKLFEIDGCNRYTSIKFHFTNSDIDYVYFFGSANFYFEYRINNKTGDIQHYNKIEVPSDGLIYDVSNSGNTFAVRDYQTFSTFLIDSNSMSKKSQWFGTVVFLNEENHFLLFTDENQIQVHDNGKILCTIENQEYLAVEMNKTGSTIAIFDRDRNIQIWNLINCELINKVTFE